MIYNRVILLSVCLSASHSADIGHVVVVVADAAITPSPIAGTILLSFTT